MRILKIEPGFATNHSNYMSVYFYVLIKGPLQPDDRYYHSNSEILKVIRNILGEIMNKKIENGEYTLTEVASSTTEWDEEWERDCLEPALRALRVMENKYPTLLLVDTYTEGELSTLLNRVPIPIYRPKPIKVDWDQLFTRCEGGLIRYPLLKARVKQLFQIRLFGEQVTLSLDSVVQKSLHALFEALILEACKCVTSVLADKIINKPEIIKAKLYFYKYSIGEIRNGHPLPKIQKSQKKREQLFLEFKESIINYSYLEEFFKTLEIENDAKYALNSWLEELIMDAIEGIISTLPRWIRGPYAGEFRRQTLEQGDIDAYFGWQRRRYNSWRRHLASKFSRNYGEKLDNIKGINLKVILQNRRNKPSKITFKGKTFRIMGRFSTKSKFSRRLVSKKEILAVIEERGGIIKRIKDLDYLIVGEYIKKWGRQSYWGVADLITLLEIDLQGKVQIIAEKELLNAVNY